MDKKLKTALASSAVLLVLTMIVIVIFFYTGIIKFNNPSEEEFPVRGVDVSHYQGKIDWERLRGQGVNFAFIKATEGSTYVDERFTENYKNASEHKVRTGAYHFFSFDSPGDTQAENFISTVPAHDGMLPPAIDVEMYGKYKSTPPEDIETVRRELRLMLSLLEDEYGLVPVIYVTVESYELFVKGGFEGYDIWIRDIFSRPSLSDGRGWTFWQYTNRGRLDGYDGEEPYIDMNVFYGSAEEFSEYGKRTNETAFSD